MSNKVIFYDPHIGLLGTMKPLPEPMLKIAKKLDGKILSLEEAMEKINDVAKTIPGEVKIVKEGKWISFGFRENPKEKLPYHLYRLIKYEEI